MLTKEALAEIEQRHKAATPGPWTSGLRAQSADGFKFSYVNTKKDCVAKTDAGWGDLAAWENAKFIAHARADIPALLAHIAELDARVAELEFELRDAHNGTP